jgi:hypothetical protein
VSVAERGWDSQYLAAWRGRIDTLADRARRASRDPAEESRRLQRLALVAEHGGEYADLVEQARCPLVLDVAAAKANHSELRSRFQPMTPKPPRLRGEVTPVRLTASGRAARIRETRTRPAPAYRGPARGFVATHRGDGTFSVSDRHGRPIPNVALTASGGLVEYVDAKPEPDTWNQSCICGHDRLGHFDRPEDQDGPCRASGCDCEGFRPAPPPLDLPPGELTARSVLRFGDLVVGFAQELAKK